MVQGHNEAVHETIFTFANLLMNPLYHDQQYPKWAPFVHFVYDKTVEELVAGQTQGVDLIFRFSGKEGMILYSCLSVEGNSGDSLTCT